MPTSASSSGAGYALALREALSRLPGLQGNHFVEVFAHGTLSVEIFAPRGSDLQQPHTRDEIYVVVSGNAEFIFGHRRVSCEAGEFLFVPAGVAHHFEHFSADFAVWVIFYGPEGGEAE